MLNRKQLIEIKHLRTFYHVSKYKSFTAAAESLYMTQPAVSQHMRKIESQIGATLFERSGGFELTREGEILLKFAEKGFKLYHELFDELDRAKNRNYYKIAISYSFCSHLREKIFKELSKISNLNLTVIHYHSRKELNFTEFDVIFGIDSLPEQYGSKIHLNASKYSIMSKSSYLIYKTLTPKRVIYCSSIDRNTAIDLISEHGGNAENVSSWLSTSSSEVMTQELENPDTIVITPNWCIADKKTHRIETNLDINMYAWCNYRSRVEIRRAGLYKIINDLAVNVEHKKPLSSLSIIDEKVVSPIIPKFHIASEKAIMFNSLDSFTAQ